MAKAAVEGANGVNLFGDHGASWSVVYADIDAHTRSRTILDTMFPLQNSNVCLTMRNARKQNAHVNGWTRRKTRSLPRNLPRVR